MTDDRRHTVLFETLGCKLNFSETATLRKALAERGIVPAGEGDTPDICVVNTCSVTALADSKCRQHIRRLAKRFPEALIAVTGCYAQLQSRQIAAIEGVDIVVGNEQKADLPDYIEQWLADRSHKVEVTPTKDIRRFSPSCDHGDRTRYWLKVQDGCDYYCTYCTIPMARGRSRSGTVGQLTAMAREVAREGGREIVLTGVNIGDFGKHTDERLIDLLRALDGVEGIDRYRISSLEPDLLTDEIIDFCATSQRFMPHFHLPLQAGSDEVLRLMHRHYDTDLFARKVEQCRNAMPDCFIGVDVMVGARGETDLLFEQSYNFVNSLDVQHLHVFPYSERPGTKALGIPCIVGAKAKQERAARMNALSRDKQRQFINRHLGTRRTVLFEQPHSDGTVQGFTDNYIRVSVAQNQGMPAVNTLMPVEMVTVGDDLTVQARISPQHNTETP